MGIDTGGRRIRGDAAKSPAWIGALLTLVVLSAPVSLDAEAGAAHSGAPAEDSGSGVSMSPFPGEDAAAHFEAADLGSISRGTNTTVGFIGGLLKTYTTDPLVRPVTTAKSLGYLVKNSVSDSAQRVVINTVRLPALKTSPVPPLSTDSGMDLEQWEKELDRITGSEPSRGKLEFFVDGAEYFPALIEEIARAEESIQLRTYIFDNDDFAIRIADLLKLRSREVDVTVLMDGFGTLRAAQTIPSSMPVSFEPPASITHYLEDGSRVKARALTNPWFTGDHCKVIVIDRKRAFLGGMNIGREYRFDWHDLMVRLDGAVVDDLARNADDAWAHSGMLGDLALLRRSFERPETPAADDGYPVRILYTQAQNSQIYNAQLAAIRRARRYIYMESPYFSDDAILFELVRARRRGVDVRFIIPMRGDMPLMDMSNIQAINEMLANGIRVYVYPGMTHVKAALFDDWLTVGSANLDKLSMRVNFEVNVATSHPEAARELKERLFHPDFEKSVELRQQLPTNLGHRIAEVMADVLM